jgi:hypothetical protein
MKKRERDSIVRLIRHFHLFSISQMRRDDYHRCVTEENNTDKKDTYDRLSSGNTFFFFFFILSLHSVYFTSSRDSPSESKIEERQASSDGRIQKCPVENHR